MPRRPRVHLDRVPLHIDQRGQNRDACFFAGAVPKLLISLGSRYVPNIDRTYGRTGTLWDSRYKSSLIDAETYLLSCMRYIELDPVHAGMVTDPAHYRWSSDRHNGLGQGDPLVTPDPLYRALARAASDKLPTARASVPSSTTRRSTTSGLRSTRASPWATAASTPVLPRSPANPVKPAPRGRPFKTAGAGVGGYAGEQRDLDLTD